MEETEAQRIAVFQQLADQRLEASYRLANAILRDESQSQDSVHDAFVVAWQQWTSLRDHSKFDAWFDRIVHVSRNRLRDGRKRRASDITTEVSATTSDSTASVHDRILLEQAFDKLKPDDAVVLALRHFLDLQLDDIAMLLDGPLQTVNSRLRSARTRLRERLDQQPSGQVPR